MRKQQTLRQCADRFRRTPSKENKKLTTFTITYYFMPQYYICRIYDEKYNDLIINV